MRGEESKLSENNQGIEKVKQQHFIQEDKVCFNVITAPVLKLCLYILPL